MIELGSGDHSSHVNGQGHILSVQIKLTLSPRPTNNLGKGSLGCKWCEQEATNSFSLGVLCLEFNVQYISDMASCFWNKKFRVYLIGVSLIFIIQLICNGNETFSLLGSRFIRKGQNWSRKVKPLYQQLPLQLTISWISKCRPIKSNLLVSWINWVRVIRFNRNFIQNISRKKNGWICWDPKVTLQKQK